jgi:epoxyqueuosine reductase
MDADPLIRRHAAWALGHIGGHEAEQALRSQVEIDPDAEVQEEIRLALSEPAR